MGFGVVIDTTLFTGTPGFFLALVMEIYSGKNGDR